MIGEALYIDIHMYVEGLIERDGRYLPDAVLSSSGNLACDRLHLQTSESVRIKSISRQISSLFFCFFLFFRPNLPCDLARRRYLDIPDAFNELDRLIRSSGVASDDRARFYLRFATMSTPCVMSLAMNILNAR